MNEDEKPIPPNLRRFMVKKQGGREYLVVAGRLVWFRQDYPEAGIVTEIISEEWSEATGNVVKMRASIFLPDGRLLATGTARQAELGKDGFADYMEKCETAAVGRALLMAGYGTANAQELDDEGKLAESPLEEKPRPRPAPTLTGRSDPRSQDPTRRPAPRREPAPPPGWTPEDEEEYRKENGRGSDDPLEPAPPRPRGRTFDDSEAPPSRR